MTTVPAETHATSRALLAGTGVDHDHVLDVVRAALAEDLAWGPDITTQATIAPDAHGTAHVVTRDSGTIAGLGVAAAVPEILWAATGDTSLPPADVSCCSPQSGHF